MVGEMNNDNVRTALAIVLMAIATLLVLLAAWLVAYEVAADEPQYLTVYAIKEVRGWLAAAILVGVAAILAVVGVRLYAATRTTR